MVKGVTLVFDKSPINIYYGLEDIENGEYESYLKNVDYDKVIQTKQKVE